MQPKKKHLTKAGGFVRYQKTGQKEGQLTGIEEKLIIEQQYAAASYLNLFEECEDSVSVRKKEKQVLFQHHQADVMILDFGKLPVREKIWPLQSLKAGPGQTDQ